MYIVYKVLKDEKDVVVYIDFQDLSFLKFFYGYEKLILNIIQCFEKNIEINNFLDIKIVWLVN